MKKVPYIWKNGRFVKWNKATTHVLSHTLHYSAGVFEGIRFYKTKEGPAVFRLKEHVDRLFYSAKAMGMKIPYTKKEITEAILKSIKKNKIKSGYIRPLAYFGYGQMGISTKGAKVDIIIAIWSWGSYLGEESVKAKISPFIRIHPLSTVSDAKICGHYINSILASRDAQKDRFHEAILLDHEGYVAEGPAENIFMVKGGKLFTPSKGSILPGITRDTITTIARDLEYPVTEKKLKPADLKSAQEAFFTGTAAEVTPIAQIDKRKLKHRIGPITAELKKAYLDVVHGRNPKHKKWLSLT